LDPITAILNIGNTVLDKFFPDKAEAERAKLELLKMSQSGELESAKVQLSAIIAEANSADPWTSRARPSFLYVMYILILFSIPMGVLSVYRPETATQIANGMKSWLAAIPDMLWQVFGAGYLGYVAARQWGKVKGTDK